LPCAGVAGAGGASLSQATWHVTPCLTIRPWLARVACLAGSGAVDVQALDRPRPEATGEPAGRAVQLAGKPGGNLLGEAIGVRHAR
jgi:hypothetical protein